MSRHYIDLGPGDDVVVTAHKMTEAKLVRGKDGAPDRKRVKDNRLAPPAPTPPAKPPVIPPPIVARAAAGLDWDIRVEGDTMTARLIAAAGGGTSFAYTPTPPPDPVPDPPPTPDPPSDPPSTLQGFGAAATGGAGHSVVYVTNLNDGGAGSFKNALGSNRIIRFTVAGTIDHGSSAAYIDGYDNLTIDGSTAPGKGIYFAGYPIFLRGGATNIIINDIHHVGDASLAGTQEGDCITIGNDASGYNTSIAIYNCSFRGWTDEAIGIWGPGNADITVAHCIFSGVNPGDPAHAFGMVMGGTNSGAVRVSVYRNLFYKLEYRQPASGWNSIGSGHAPEVVGDIRNNLIWDYAPRYPPQVGYGTSVYYGSKANVIANYYRTQYLPADTNAIELSSDDQGASAYISGNYSKDGSSFPSDEVSAYSVRSNAAITTVSAASAAANIVDQAGCRVGGLDAHDAAIIDAIETAGL